MSQPRPSVLAFVTAFPVVSQTAVVDHLRGLLHHGWAVHLACLEFDADRAGHHRDLVCGIASIHVLGDGTARPHGHLRRASLLAASLPGRPWDDPPHLRRARYLAPSVGRVVDAVRPDIVHAHWGHNAVAAALSLRRRDVPLVADLHGFDLTEIPSRTGWDVYTRYLSPHTLVVHSSYARDLVRAGMNREPAVVKFGVDAAFDPIPRASAWTAPLRLVSVGRLVPEKGHDTAIDIVGRLAAQRPDLDPRLTIIGGGPQRDELGRLAAGSGQGDRVRFVGELEVAGVARLLAESDVLVVASRPSPTGWVEVFGRVAAEGVATGLAVVASRTGGLPEVVGDGGRLAEPGDAGSFVETILAVIDETPPDEVARRSRRQAATMTLERYWSESDALARRVARATGPS